MKLTKKTFAFPLLAALAAGVALSGSAHAAADGQQLYNANCSLCHQVGGAGVPGMYPTLKGRIGTIASSAEGKTYVMHVLLNGLSGTIKAGGNSYTGYMPSFVAQTDENVAAILTYVASLGDAKPAPTFTADDVKAARAAGTLAPAAILDERKKLDAVHPVP